MKIPSRSKQPFAPATQGEIDVLVNIIAGLAVWLILLTAALIGMFSLWLAG